MGEDETWNAFRSQKRSAAEKPSLSQWMVTALQALKLLIFIVSSGLITAGALFSKLLIVIVSTNIHDPPRTVSDPFTNKCTQGVVRNKRSIAGMFIFLALVQCVPDTISLIRALIRIQRGTRGGKMRIAVVLLEGMRALGLSLLVFFVFPQLDPARCILLSACLPLVAVIQHLMSSMANAARPSPRFITRIVRSMLSVPHFIVALIFFSGTYLWAVMDVPFKAKAALPIGLLLASIGFWESWISHNHEGTIFHRLYQIKFGVRKLNPITRAMQSLTRIVCVLTVMLAASHDVVKGRLLWRAVSSFSLDFPETRLVLAALSLCLLHSLLRGLARFLAALDMRMLSFLHPMTLASPLLYVMIRYVCSSPVCSVSSLLSSLPLRWHCDGWQPRPFDDWYLCLVWLVAGTHRAWTYVRQRTFDKDDEVIDSLSPSTNGLCVEQSLVVFQHSLSKKEFSAEIDEDPCEKGESAIRNDEVDRTLTLYICATMWHETTVEMTQMVSSILKLDKEHSRRLSEKKSDQLQFRLEGHIYFDDAWTDKEEEDGVVRRVPNEFFETFFLLLNEMTGELPDVFGRLSSRVLVSTPYGGRVVIRLPAGTMLFVHLKDKSLIRHKKRWSQVMYMYYLLGHRIMDSALSIEDRQQLADSTFVLAIDGDSKFEPEAVLRLLSLMQQKSDIGCACGRIHPIGSGIMVWYQKFEYAIAHWFQKAAEHVFGCVLCAPGCFSLFRASALMDDNIMHKYTKTADQPRHFVQYDQGEDRWLSTLMLKQGYRIEYAAASDAETYAPEGFEEFFNQRRRWTPSSIANTVDLLADYKRAVQNNASISTAYIAYQFMVIAFSMLGPAIIFSMVVFSQVAAFGSNSATMMIWNGIPILLFVFLCFTTESPTQLFYAKMMSIVYAFVMLAVLVATSSQIVLETVVSPTSMFIVAMVLIFLMAACLHPREFTNIIYGTVFFMMIPSTYIFLSLYSLINLNVINWGTREAVAKATGKVESRSPMERWLQTASSKAEWLTKRIFSSKKNPAVDALKEQLDQMERKMTDMKNGVVSDDVEAPADRLDDSLIEKVDKVATAPIRAGKMAWMTESYLEACERGRLKAAEEKFWNQLIESYLKPIVSTPAAQLEVASGLASLRNNIAFSIIIINALLALAIYLIQKHKNVLSIKWTPYDGFKWTKMNEMNGQFEETEDPLKIDPLGMAIIVFLLAILIVQTIGMLIHRVNTLFSAFQEVSNVHDLAMMQTKKRDEDERILSAARHMLGTSIYPSVHASDGFTRLPSLVSSEGNVLFKLQRARLAERMKRGALDPH